MITRNCTVEDCERPNRSHGLCSMHARRLAKHGTTDKYVPVKSTLTCKHEDCHNKHDSHGYCANHARQFRKFGHPLSKEEVYENRCKARLGNKNHLGKKWSDALKEEVSRRSKGIRKNTGRTHFKKGHVTWNTGLSGWMTKEHQQKLIDIATGREAWNKGKRVVQIQGEKNWIWAGDNVSYRSLHKWVQWHLGKPGKCEHCKKDNLSKHQIHWSNISGDYLRDLDDWQRLCAKCHAAYDKQLRVARMRG